MKQIKPLHTLLIFAAVLILCLPAVIYTTGSEYHLWGEPTDTDPEDLPPEGPTDTSAPPAVTSGDPDITTTPPETETPPPSSAPADDTTTAPELTDAPETTAAPVTEPPQPAVTGPTEQYTGFVDVDFSYFSDALFIGDSRTVGLRDYTAGNLASATFFCSSGMNASYARRSEYDYTTGVDASGRKTTLGRGTLETLLTERDFGKVYIMVGINELGDSTQNILRNITLLRDTVARLEPNAIIFMCANLHVTAEYSQNGSKKYINNDKINEVNTGIAALADNQNSFFIDINPLFDDASNALTASYGSDGVHVYGKYYRRWSEWLCTRGVIR